MTQGLLNSGLSKGYMRGIQMRTPAPSGEGYWAVGRHLRSRPHATGRIILRRHELSRLPDSDREPTTHPRNGTGRPPDNQET